MFCTFAFELAKDENTPDSDPILIELLISQKLVFVISIKKKFGKMMVEATRVCNKIYLSKSKKLKK